MPARLCARRYSIRVTTNVLGSTWNKSPNTWARIDNVYFLKHLGSSLRKAAGQIATEELPEDIRILLRRLERLETRGKLGKVDCPIPGTQTLAFRRRTR